MGVSCLCPGLVRTRINESDRNRPEELRRPLIPEQGTPAVDPGMHAAIRDRHELATQLGTVLAWEAGGTSFVLAGSQPAAAAEAAARAVK